jgi:hypothetical protein
VDASAAADTNAATKEKSKVSYYFIFLKNNPTITL